MPSAFLYLGIMLGVIVIWFMLLKRPVYEAVLISFLVLLTVTGTWGNVLSYFHAHNTFDAPEVVVEKDFQLYKLTDNGLLLTMPKNSVVEIRLAK